MNLWFWQKVNREKLGRLCRRAVALALALSLELPAASLAYDAMGNPTPAVSGEAPTITIEANAVVDRWYDSASPAMDVRDYLTGELEVAIRVQSGKIGTEWQAFDTIGVALKYSPILTPYKFTLINGIDLSGKTDVTAQDKKDAAVAVDLTGTQDFTAMTTMQTLKSKNIATATGHVSGEKDKGGYLFMEVEANRPLVLEEDTVLAVVTFHYDVEQYQIVAAEAAKWLTPLTTAVTPPGGGGTSTAAEGDPDPGTDPGPGTDPTPTPDPVCLLQFATRAELGGRYGKYELEYSSANNDFLYSADPDAADINFMQLDDKTTDLYHGAPTPERVNFRLVNQTTYNDGGLTLDDLATVLFYDWDDTLIGVLIVPRDGDARKLVNDYVRDNMIHPDLRTGKPVDSLARENNYRGKYPCTPMAENGTDATMDSKRTDGLLGKDYPLTNKLDYVFMKRPMEKVTTDVNGDPIDTNTWRQKGTEETAEWETGFPYIYGWGLIPDDNFADIQYTHPENLWTTIGIGELTTYTGLYNGAYPDASAITKAPSELTSLDSKFAFADFNFKKHSLKPGSVYAVKAIYEPGEDLLYDGYSYRMISEPYYNKLNNYNARNGAAYNIDVTFERASLDENGEVHGVARVRSPAVRQETTTDLRWENEFLENATIAEQTSKTKTTYTNVTVKNKDIVDIQLVLSGRQNKVDYYLAETYGAGFVAGGGRSLPNKDYKGSAHAIDNYNYNTADNDTDRTYYRAEYTSDNEMGMLVDDRSGTYGFVLLGTLNNMAQQATKYDRGDIIIGTYRTYISLDNLVDANIRVNGNAVAVATWSAVQNAWHAAAITAEKAHNGDGVAATDEWWDAEHDCAQFTYHQIQLFVNDYVAKYKSESAAGTDAAHLADYRAWLKDAVSADAETISWCNLHEECAASRSGKPTSFEKMVRAALGQKLPAGVTDPRDVISLLTMAEAEAMSHLRADKRGPAFADIGALADAFVTAVQEVNKYSPIDPSVLVPASDGSKSEAYWKVWDAIQGYILSDPKPTDKAGVDAATKLSRDTAWWNEGESAPSAGSLSDLVAAEKKAVATGRDAWINYYRYRDAFDDMKQNGVSPQAQWTRITENLVKDIDGTPYATYDEFKTAFRAAVAALGAPDPETPDQYYWYKLQYHMAGDTRPADVSTYNTYWWHNGYSRINDLASLLLAAQRATSGGEAIWAMLSLDDLYDEDLKELHFRSGFNGTTDKYADGAVADLDDFKAGVLEFINKTGALIVDADSNSDEKTNAWNQLQYYLIHRKDPGGCDLTADSTYEGMDREIGYYWWRGGAAGEDYTALNPGTDTINLQTLMEAAYRHAVNGNPQAYVMLDAAAADKFRLIDSYDKDSKPANWDALDRYQDATVSGLYTKLDALVKEVIAKGDGYNTPNWRQIQHYLLGKGYVTKADLAADDTKIPSDLKTDADGYWWKEGTENPGTAVGPIKTTWDEFIDSLVEYMNSDMGTAAVDAINAKVDEYFIASKLNMRGLGTKNAVKLYASLTDPQKNTVKTTVRTLAYNLKNTQGVSNADGVNGLIDWYVVQYYLVQTKAANKITTTTNPLVSKADAKTFCDGKSYAPPAGSIPDNTRSVRSLQANMMLKPAETLPEETPEPEQVETVITTAETELPDGTRLEVKTYTRIDPDTGKTVTRTVVTHWAADGTLLSETVTDPEDPDNGEEPQPTESPDPTESPEPTESVGPDDPIGPEVSPDPTESPDPEKPGTYTQDEDAAIVDPVDPTPTTTETVGPDDPIGPMTPDNKEHLVTVPVEVDPPFVSGGQQDRQDGE